MSYTVLYRQAMSEGNTDRAHTVLTSAIEAARSGAINEEELAELVAEVKAQEGEA
ncbi:hypothetical protein AB0I87_13490 [Streptomyces sp. NPDC049952]|uniref:hypothetical protein n=1 Tax=Streptomyces sp. NPDC049952 TaxID=3156665 RepID=UPI00341FBFB5